MSVQAARDFLAAKQDDLIDFLQTLVTTPSITVEMGERTIADRVKAVGRDLGLGEPDVLAAVPEHPNLLYRFDGPDPGPTLILNAHLDTQPVGDPSAWTHDPFAADTVDGRMYGLGTSDMKGAVAALVYACAALVQTDAIPAGRVLLALVANEEAGGTYGADWLVRHGHVTGDACVVCEPAGVRQEWEAIYNGQRGQSGVWVRVSGDQMHSGVAHILGARNAAVRMARVMDQLDRALRITAADPALGVAQATLGVGIRCGVAWGINPGVADFGIDVRTTPGMTQDDVARGMEDSLAVVRQVHADIETQWWFDAPPRDWIAPTRAAPESGVVRAAQHAAEIVLGQIPPLGTYPATTDASAFEAVGGIPTLAALGPGRISLAHKADEYVTLASVIEAAHLYAVLATLYLAEAKTGRMATVPDENRRRE
ncbi:MAG TPA: M20 family metallopeptidase [Chloroflexota bacterium]|nr:M20 family metallopeptidase [Chloroflexota bacterium]